MKRYFLFLLLFFIPIAVQASGKYDIENMWIDANILPNGNVQMKELIVLNGSFKEFVRTIKYRDSSLKYAKPMNFWKDAIYNGSGIQNVSLKAKKITIEPTHEMIEDPDFEVLTKNYYMEDAQNKEYVESSIQDGKSYRMYYEGNYDTVAFLLEYTITDVIVLHKDIAEFYYSFIDDDFNDKIDKLKIQVTLPYKDETNNLNWWSHGDLTSQMYEEENQKIISEMTRLKSNSTYDIRMTFSNQQMNIQNKAKVSNEIALSKILEIEKKQKEKSEEERIRTKTVQNALWYTCFLFDISLVVCWIFIYIRYGREEKKNWKEKYESKINDKYNVEVLDVLMNDDVSPHAFIASFLNLLYKKNIIWTKKENSHEFIFQYVSSEGLNDTEEVLIHFLVDKIGKNEPFTLKDIKKYKTSSKTSTQFQNQYQNWARCVIKDAEHQNFYEKNGIPVIIGLFFLLVSIFIFFAVFYFGQSPVIILLTFGLGVLFFFYCTLLKKRTKKGQEDFWHWQSFETLIKDFAKIPKDKLPDFSLWNQYLVYSAVFDLEEQLETDMRIRQKEFRNSNEWLDYQIVSYISQKLMEIFEEKIKNEN